MNTLAELAIRRPGAARVFHKHRLDFCCGGRRSLAEACEARGLDPDAVLAEIDAERRTSDDVLWSERALVDLVEHIIIRFHEPLRPELERLTHLARRVEAVHGDKPTCPHGLAEHLERFREETLEHLEKEERILFPLITTYPDARPHAPISVMLHEHEAHAANLAKIRALTNDLVAPPEACTTWRALYLGLAELERDLMDHIHLENNVLFPRALGA